jgi:hypothetical protein
MDAALGVAKNNAFPNQAVSVQMSGVTNLVNSFSQGRNLYLSSPPGS